MNFIQLKIVSIVKKNLEIFLLIFLLIITVFITQFYNFNTKKLKKIIYKFLETPISRKLSTTSLLI